MEFEEGLRRQRLRDNHRQGTGAALLVAAIAIGWPGLSAAQLAPQSQAEFEQRFLWSVLGFSDVLCNGVLGAAVEGGEEPETPSQRGVFGALATLAFPVASPATGRG